MLFASSARKPARLSLKEACSVRERVKLSAEETGEG